MAESRLESMFAEMINLYKLVNKDKISLILSEELNDDKKIAVYNISDGLLTSRQVGDKTGVSHVTVLNYWKRWVKLGLVFESDTKGRYIHSFDLDNYDLESKE